MSKVEAHNLVMDNILSILDFRMESLEGEDGGFIGDWDATKSQFLRPIPSDVLIDTGPFDLQPKFHTHIDASHELKQELSYRPEDTPCSFIFRPNKGSEFQEEGGVFRTQSPVSMIEGNGSYSSFGEIMIPPIVSCNVKRARTKRARPSGLSPWLWMSPPFPAATKTCNAQKKREMRYKLSQQNRASQQQPIVTKRCSHCQVTKTPQWREGPKTLCNACGVRHQSGRLLPEYRPAASPTFVPSLHSNSHKKVVEMRTKAQNQQATGIEQNSTSLAMEFIPMITCIFDSIS